MAEDRIEDIGSGDAAQTETETKDGQDQVRTSGERADDPNPPQTATGAGEDLTPEKATAAEEQQAEVRASEAAERMDDETEVEDEVKVDAKHPQIAFTANNGEICEVEIEIGDRIVCYCQGNRVVMDVVEKDDDDTFVGINQSSSDFLSKTAQIEYGNRIFFCGDDVFSVEKK